MKGEGQCGLWKMTVGMALRKWRGVPDPFAMSMVVGPGRMDGWRLRRLTGDSRL